MPEKLSIFDSAESERRYNDAYSAALSLWPIPFEETFITGKFGDTHVITSGPKDARPLVLFHPAGCGSVIWYRNVDSISRNCATFAIDMIGEVNRSTVTNPPKSPDDLLAWIDELFIALQIAKADLVGNSFGGYLAALCAVYRPELVRRVVLISPAATITSMNRWMWHFFPGYITGSNSLKKWAYDWIWQGYPADACIAEMRTIASRCGIPKHVPPKVLNKDELRSVGAPTLLLIGDHEVIYSPTKAIARAKRLISNLEAHIVPNANHNAEYTAPEYVSARIASFLSD